MKNLWDHGTQIYRVGFTRWIWTQLLQLNYYKIQHVPNRQRTINLDDRDFEFSYKIKSLNMSDGSMHANSFWSPAVGFGLRIGGLYFWNQLNKSLSQVKLILKSNWKLAYFGHCTLDLWNKITITADQKQPGKY